LCADLGRDLLREVVPGGETRPTATDFELFNEASCSVDTPVAAPLGTNRRSLFVQFNRYGQDKSGRTASEICRQAVEGYRMKYAADWQHPSASPIPLRLGDVTHAQVRAIRRPAEAEILLCRSADLLRVEFEAEGIDRAQAASTAERVARHILAVYPR
jgi:hypothetical protein